MINSLTGLRAVAALAVFLFHVSVVRLDDKRLNIDFLNFFLIHNGDFGVDIFFVLSGYVIALVYAKKFEHFEFKQYKRFVYARLIRLLPVHLFTMTLMIFAFHLIRSSYGGAYLNSFNYEYRSIFFSSLLIHEWLSSENFLMKISSMAFDVNSFGKIGTPNSVSWSISAEFFAYLLFPFLLKFIRIGRDFSLVLINIIIGFVIYENLIPRDGLIRVLFCFTVGLWVRFYLHDFIPEVLKKSRWMGWCALTILLLLLSFYRMSDGGAPYYFAIMVTSIMISFLAINDDYLGGVLSNKLLVYLGEISYSFYMIHWFCLKFVERILSLGANYSNWMSFLYFTLSFLVSILAASLMYKYIENPIRIKLRHAY